MPADEHDVSAVEIVERVASAWASGADDATVIADLGKLGLCEEHAAQAVDMVRSAYSRALLLSSGMNASQFSSDFEDDAIFQAALHRARAEISSRPQHPKVSRRGADLQNAAPGSSQDSKGLAGLERDLRSPDTETRRKAVYQLGRSQDRSAPRLLLTALADPDSYVRVYAIQSLRDLRSREAVPALAMLLGSEQGIVFENAVHALVKIGDQSAVPALIEATRHANPSLRSLAAWALGELGDRRAASALQVLLRDTARPPDNIYSVRDQAQRALRRLRPWWRWFW